MNCDPKDVKRCQFMLSSPFKKCIMALGREVIMKHVKSCEIDVCVYLKSPRLNEVFCRAIEGLTQLCEYSGFNINWRTLVNCRKFH